jgi:hypothetical protein
MLNTLLQECTFYGRLNYANDTLLVDMEILLQPLMQLIFKWMSSGNIDDGIIKMYGVAKS